MTEFQIGGKPLFTQTGTDNPVMDSGVNVDSTLVGATFPAGHVIQTVMGTDITWDGVSVSSTLDWVSKSITRKKSDSQILVTFSGHYARSTVVDNGVRLNRNHNGVDSLLGNGEGSAAGTGRTYQNIWTPGTDTGYMQTGGTGGVFGMAPVSFSFLDTPTDSTLLITYTVSIWVESTLTIYRNGDGWRGAGTQSYSTMAKLVLQEIAV